MGARLAPHGTGALLEGLPVKRFRQVVMARRHPTGCCSTREIGADRHCNLLIQLDSGSQISVPVNIQDPTALRSAHRKKAITLLAPLWYRKGPHRYRVAP